MEEEKMLYQAALSAMAETLEQDPFDKEKGHSHKQKKKKKKKTKELEDQDDGDDEHKIGEQKLGGLDTGEVSDLIQYCKQREAEDAELVNVLETFMRSRQEMRRSYQAPWERIERLSNTVLEMERELANSKAESRAMMEKNHQLQYEVEKWKQATEQKRIVESAETRQQGYIVEQLREQVEHVETECDSLRKQRDILQRDLDVEKDHSAKLQTQLESVRNENENNKQELAKWKRTSEKRIQHLVGKVQELENMIKTLDQFKQTNSKRLHDFENNNTQLEQKTLSLKRQLEQKTEQTQVMEKQMKELQSKLEKQAQEMEGQLLKWDQNQIDHGALQRRNTKLSEQIAQLQEQVETLERNRIESFKENELKQDALYKEIETYRSKEDSWKKRLLASQRATESVKEEMTKALKDSEERTRGLEETLNKLLKNMERSSRFVRQESTNNQREDDDRKNDALKFSIDEESRNVISEKANKIRMEIMAATEGIMEQSKTTIQPPMEKSKPTRRRKNSLLPMISSNGK